MIDRNDRNVGLFLHINTARDSTIFVHFTFVFTRNGSLSHFRVQATRMSIF